MAPSGSKKLNHDAGEAEELLTLRWGGLPGEGAGECRGLGPGEEGRVGRAHRSLQTLLEGGGDQVSK